MGVYLLGAVEMSRALLEALAPRLSGVIGLKSTASDLRSGYVDLEPHARAHGLPFTPVYDYRLRRAEDRARLEALPLDVLLVFGWQRLIPPWLLAHASAALGGHGSPWGILGGRGRSPQNWAILLGAPSFEIALFHLTPSADAGPVIATRRFRYGPRDDINDAYAKVNAALAEMLHEALSAPRLPDGVPQVGRAYYLPARRPEDGGIDWRQPVQALDAQIRALTRPYPGAFCDYAGGRITIWRARPLDLPAEEGAPGQILRREGEALWVRVGQGGALALEGYTITGRRLEIGEVLPSIDAAEALRRVLARHDARNPHQPIQPALLRGGLTPEKEMR
ncbi:hypothetical protein KKF91_17440 [Myxococcota bacterium]|nr:hypothetical protein [Myxococcota bacterium]MBU1432325.1 hypothetical protein [Myxococcota bacterium]MBU1897045.1 hypothetical protein [Myxococcota bacterium]